jgi:hypothetical protein
MPRNTQTGADLANIAAAGLSNHPGFLGEIAASRKRICQSQRDSSSSAQATWDNLTSKSGRFWRQSLADSGTNINNRRQYWSYDAEGNVVGGDGKSHTYDAAGKQTLAMSATDMVGGSGTGHPAQPGWEIAQTYNVEGKPIKRLETRRSEEMIGEGPQTNITETVTTTYYLYSSVLGTQVVELDGNGVKTKGYVYANGERLAKQEVSPSGSAVWWYHLNPGTNSWVEVSEGGMQRQEMDPMGAEVGTSDPYLSFPEPKYLDLRVDGQLYLEGGDPFDYGSGYEIDGMPVSASQLRHMLDTGSVVAGLHVNGHMVGFWDFTGHGNWGLLNAGYSMDRGSTGATARDWPDGDVVPGGETSNVPFQSRNLSVTFGFRRSSNIVRSHHAQQKPVPRHELSDCIKFADMVREIANDTVGRDGDVQTFMNRIATTFTEYPGATISDIIRATNFAEGNWPIPNVFGSEGFAPAYYEQDFVWENGRRERMNQVRHAAGGLVIGYAFAPFPQRARDRMNGNENPNDPIHGVPDLNLNAQTLPMGEKIGVPGGNRRLALELADWIKKTLCK